MKAAAEGPLAGILELHRGPDRLDRHRHRPRVLHHRRPADQRLRQRGQGGRLVRQRVGLLQPAGRPGRLRRPEPVASGMQSLDALCPRQGVGRRSPRPRPLRPQRADGRRRHHRRRTDPGQPAHPAARWSTPVRRVVVAAHLGRPKGEVEPGALARARRRTARRSCSSRPVAVRRRVLERDARQRQRSTRSTPGERAASWRTSGSTPRETSKDDTERAELADAYARLCDVFVSDGFGVVHRKQASVYDIAQRRPALRRAAGRRPRCEVLTRLTDDPARPYVVVLGGSKVSDKLGVIEHLLERVDRMLVGGGMVFTFLAAQGHDTGTSLLEADQVETVRGLLARRRAPWRRGRAAERHRRGRPVRGRRRVARWSRADAIPSGDRWAWTSVPQSQRAVRRAAGRCARRCSGTVRWASSSSRRSPPAPVRSPRRWSTAPGSPSSAAATRPPRCGPSASTRRPSATSRPAAGRRLEYLEGRELPGHRGARHARHPEGRSVTDGRPQAADGRQLEDEPQPLRGDAPGAGPRVPARATPTSRRSRWWCCRRSPTSGRCRR